LAKKTKKKRWMSIYVIFFTMFLSAVSKLLKMFIIQKITQTIVMLFTTAFSIALSSIWPYLLEVSRYLFQL
jgi:putative flippase GtrA